MDVWVQSDSPRHLNQQSYPRCCLSNSVSIIQTSCTIRFTILSQQLLNQHLWMWFSFPFFWQTSRQPCCFRSSAVPFGRSVSLCRWWVNVQWLTPVLYTHGIFCRTSLMLSHRYGYKNRMMMKFCTFIFCPFFKIKILFPFHRITCSVASAAQSRTWS